nr:nap1-binding protein 2 [Quercus suber]
MTEVLSPTPHNTMSTPSESPAHPADSPSTLPSKLREQPQPSERAPSYAQNRMSSFSQHSQQSSRSGPRNSVYPAFHSSLPYALVRDFAYPAFDPMHYGSPPEPPSGSTTPGSEWNTGRRSSDPMEVFGKTPWGNAGPWGGDGVLYGDPAQEVEPLPSTSFGDEEDEGVGSTMRGKHRKSKSYAHITDFERGRRRESGHRRISQYSGQQSDPAGRDSLRHSRSYGNSDSRLVEPVVRGNSHVTTTTTLPPRRFHQSEPAGSSAPNPDHDMPLDSEHSAHVHSPQRYSIGPEDEELFAGESLALYSFEPENANELRLSEGQHILVSYRHGQGWLVAEDKETGEQGLVPEAYVRLISDIPNYDPELRTFVNVEEGAEEDEDMDDYVDDPEHGSQELDDGEEGTGSSILSHTPASAEAGEHSARRVKEGR